MAEDTELDAEAFADALAGDEDGRRLLALRALQECDRRGPLPDAVLEPLLACLESRRKAVQRTAAEVLAQWSSATPEIRSRLLARLRGGDFHGRWGAAFALAKIGAEPAALDVLVETLGQSDGDMRWAAEGIVVELARRNAAVHRGLVDLVGAGSAAQRKMAMYALRDLGEPVERLPELLLSQLGHDDTDVRLAALSALARLYPSSPATVPAIIALVRRDPEPGVRRAAVSTLGKFASSLADDPEIARAIDEAASSDDPSLRRAALGARRRIAGTAARTERDDE